MKILITGACGFVGSSIANRLSGKNIYTIVAIDNLQFGKIENLNTGIPFWKKSFNDLTDEMLAQFDTIIHCATSNIIYAMDHILETFDNNAIHTLNLFSRFKGRIIYTSTASVYGQADTLPTPEQAPLKLRNAYDHSKYIGEQALRARGNYAILRLSNVYGPNQRPDNPYCGVMGKLLQAAIEGKPMQIFGEGQQTRDFTYISDVVDAVEKVLNRTHINMLLNISTGIETSVMQLAQLVARAADCNFTIDKKPQRQIDGIERRCIDRMKAYATLGWEPKLDMLAGITKTYEWMKEVYYKDNSVPTP